ncbi:MAG: hypothetical protein VB959_24485, partial [Rhodospirillales bacterium]
PADNLRASAGDRLADDFNATFGNSDCYQRKNNTQKCPGQLGKSTIIETIPVITAGFASTSVVLI